MTALALAAVVFLGGMAGTTAARLLEKRAAVRVALEEL